MAETGQELYRRAKKLIPGGTQLLSKRPEMFLPDHWPAYFSRARGVEVWDLTGTRYIDMCYNGIGACLLGFADPDVDGAVKKAIDKGSMATLNCPEEVELAEVLCDLHPWAEMVRYARGGGEAMAVAVRIARAATGRDAVAFCGYHGWHDWYLAANLSDDRALDGHLLPGLSPAGVPRALRNTVFPFRYNQLSELETVVASHSDALAAIVMEPLRDVEPEAGFLKGVREIASKRGCVLVFDEVTSGFRLTTGGAHLVYGVEPDIAVFAKGLSNGYPMAAVIGRAAVMEAAQRSFISSTFWTDRIGPVAALATIAKHQRCRVADHLIRVGNAVKEAWRASADRAGIPLRISGMAPLGHFAFQDHSLSLQTLFTQTMLERGFLATKSFYATYAHNEGHVEQYSEALDQVFQLLRTALDRGDVEAQLRGPVAHSGFRRLA